MSNDDPISQSSARNCKKLQKPQAKRLMLAREFGGFISRFVAGSDEQGIGIVEDKLKYMRWERQLRLMQRADQLLQEIDLPQPTRHIPLKLAIPLLEAVSLEDDDYLQDLWAKFLVNAANNGSQLTLQRAHIAILEQLTPLEAAILKMMYALPYDQARHDGIEVGKLPNEVAIRKNDGKQNELPEPPKGIRLALADIARLGCIVIQKSLGGGELFNKVNPTLLGKSYVEACTLQTP